MQFANQTGTDLMLSLPPLATGRTPAGAGGQVGFAAGTGRLTATFSVPAARTFSPPNGYAPPSSARLAGRQARNVFWTGYPYS